LCQCIAGIPHTAIVNNTFKIQNYSIVERFIIVKAWKSATNNGEKGTNQDGDEFACNLAE
jgi:hypothetical protein